MSRQTHDIVNDHAGTLVAEQIATGTATSGYVPVSTGVGVEPAWGPQTGGSSTGGGVFPVRVATTTNGTLSSSFQNGSVVDGITLATGDAILIRNQDLAGHGEQNGIRIVAASGTPPRATYYDSASEIAGSLVVVMEGTQQGTIWVPLVDLSLVVDTGDILYSIVNGLFDPADGAGNLLLGKNGMNEITYDTNDAYLNLASSGAVDLNAGPSSSMTLEVNDGTSGGTSAPKHHMVGGHGVVLPLLSADPSGGNSQEGQIYGNTTTHKVRYYNGTTWNDLF